MARWLVWAVVALGLALLAWSLQPRGEAAGTLTIRQAQFVKTDAPAPPAEDAADWVERALPDNWQRTNPGLHGYGWYRLRFRLASAPADAWGAYLPSVSTSYQLYLNGIDVGTSGGMSGEIQRAGGKPHFAPLPPQVLHAGDNELLLRLRVAPNLRGGLGPVTLGPRQGVEDLYSHDYFMRVTLSRSVNMALLFTGVLVLILWLRRPRESMYGYFAGLAILWSIRNFHYTATPQGIPSGLLEAFILGSLGVVVLLLWLFMLRFAGRRPVRAERLVAAVFLAAPPLFALLDLRLLSLLRIPWYLACAALGAWSIAVLLQFLRTPQGRARTGAWLILVAELLTLLLGLTDLAVSAELLPFGPAARMAFGAPILLCALVYAVAENYFHTFDEVRRLNTELEQRVCERTRELELTHERLRTLERSAAIAEERDRLMRDMHDGVGSQLMTTLDAVERGQLDPAGVGALLRGCIEDLRLVIDSLEPSEHSLQLALANLRYRLEPRLREAGVALAWEVDETPVAASTGQVLQIMRIVQEALANALRHAQARRLRLRLEVAGGALAVEVSDDGRGLGPQADQAPDPARPHAQRGLANMRLRARQLGGELEVLSAAPGTRVVLRVPLEILQTQDAGVAHARLS
nr:ATP-binding protein [Variovorax terrae]